MFDVACSARSRKLFGPLYFAGKDGCHCVMMLSWPDTHQGVFSECGNMVTAVSSGAGSPGAGASWACMEYTAARHNTTKPQPRKRDWRVRVQRIFPSFIKGSSAGRPSRVFHHPLQDCCSSMDEKSVIRQERRRIYYRGV